MFIIGGSIYELLRISGMLLINVIMWHKFQNFSLYSWETQLKSPPLLFIYKSLGCLKSGLKNISNYIINPENKEEKAC